MSSVASPPSSRIMFGRAAVGPLEDAVGVVPVVVQRLALDGEHRRAGGGDRRGGVVLRRVDVARRPAHVGAERLERLDQHRGLDGHVQRAGDARALQRLLRRVLLADRHQAGHLGLGDGDLLAAPVGEADVLDDIVGVIGVRGLLGLGDVVMAVLWRSWRSFIGPRTGLWNGRAPMGVGAAAVIKT